MLLILYMLYVFALESNYCGVCLNRGAFFVQFMGSTLDFLQMLCCKALLKYMCIAVYLLVSILPLNRKMSLAVKFQVLSLFPLKAKTNCKNCLNILY